MAFVCAISNVVPETPVVSPVSGSVFERRLIEKHIQENGPKDPTNGEHLELSQLIEVKPSFFDKSKAPTHTSIPAILKSLQDEWDAAMLYSFTLKQQLQTARQELSHCLYQHDAACRVVARLSKELIRAREALAVLKPLAEQTTMMADDDDETMVCVPVSNEVVGISREIQARIQETATTLTQERKAKAKIVSPSLASIEDVKNYKMVTSLTGLHSAGSPGIMCLDLLNEWIVTGGNDKVVSIYDQTSNTIVTSLKGHTKKVTNVACLNKQLVVSGSMDATAKVWHIPTSKCVQTICAHESAITGLSVHPTGDYLLLSSLDEHWSFVDLESGAIYVRKRGGADENGENGAALTSSKFHPDGLIFATGTVGAEVKVWDLKDQQNVATFTGHGGPVVAISFSENGYYLATAADDASVKLWDLRKLRNFKTIQMEPDFKISDISFDYTGSYLALAGNDVRVYACKSWNEVAIFSEHTATATGVRFGNDAGWIASTSMDRSCKIYSMQHT